MDNPRPILVVGAGIAGVTTALDASEGGARLILVEKEWTIGGRVRQLHQYFPKLCPPSCGLEINTQRLDKSQRIRATPGDSAIAAARLESG
jgi:quinone-modifying oxidoreductase subunit QmoA